MNLLEYLKSNLNNNSLKSFYSKTLKISQVSFDRINLKIEKVLLKLSFVERFYKIFFVIFFISFYLIFKQYFETGMGGDDGRFYTFYPTLYQEGLNINNKFTYFDSEFGTQYLSNSMFILSLLEKIGFTYKDFYFLIFFLSFYFFYLCLLQIKNFYKIEIRLSNYFIFFLSLLYPSNPLVLDQVWNNHWASIFSIVATPLIFLIFLKMIFKTLSFIDVIVFNLALSALSIYFINLVHVQVLIIFLLTFAFIYLFLNRDSINFFISRSLIMLILFLASNFYWIYYIFSLFSRDGMKPSDANQSLASMLDYYRTIKGWDFIFLGPYNTNNIINSDLYYQISFFLFLLLVVTSIAILISKAINYKKNEVGGLNIFSISALISFVSMAYLQTIALTEIGSKIFVLAAKLIYSLNGFKNYINKVPATYSLSLLVIIYITYFVISKKKVFIKLTFVLFTFIFSIISLRGLVNLQDYKHNLPEGYKRATFLSEDTLELIKFFKSNKEIQRVAYSPMSEGPYDIINNIQKKELFIGASPISKFSGIDNLNMFVLIEGFFNLEKSFSNEKFFEMDNEKILFRLKFFGVNKVVVNNKVNLSNFTPWGYDKTNKFEDLNKYIADNYNLIYETKNKEYSVYDLATDNIKFKNTLYKLEENTDLNFYSINFENSSVSADSLPNEYFNFFTSLSKISKIPAKNSLDIYNDDFGNNFKMEKISNTVSSNFFNKTDKIYTINSQDKNLLRVILSIPKNLVTVRVAVDEKSAKCISRIFSINSNCELFKDIKPEKIDNKYIYTIKSEETNPTNMYVLIRNNSPLEFNSEHINPEFYSAKYENIIFNPFIKSQNEKYLNKFFEYNNHSLEYQLPEVMENKRLNSDTYKIKIKLKDRKMPLIMVLRNQYDENWKLEGTYIDKQIKFNAENTFNGWVIHPTGKSDVMELTIKYKEKAFVIFSRNLSSNIFYISGGILICFILLVLAYQKKTYFFNKKNIQYSKIQLFKRKKK